MIWHGSSNMLVDVKASMIWRESKRMIVDAKTSILGRGAKRSIVDSKMIMILGGCLLLGLFSLLTVYTTSWSLEVHVRVAATVSEENQVIDRVIENDIAGKPEFYAIQEFCAASKRYPGLVFECYPSLGGIGNVLNLMEGCIRYAIEAGAAVVLPTIRRRDNADLANIATDDIEPFSYMFDIDEFLHGIKEACPQMPVYNSIADIPHWTSNDSDRLALRPQDLSIVHLNSLTIGDAPEWRGRFDRWLAEQTAEKPLSVETPRLVGLSRILFQWPVDTDSVAFNNNYGRLFAVRRDTKYLAAKVLLHMSKAFNFTLHGDEGIKGNTFYGAHLRTAADAQGAGWAGYEQQSAEFLADAQAHDLNHLYVASGSPADIDRFKLAGLELGINVTTKVDLLDEEDRRFLASLTWDQQALVDFEVLKRASKFGGIAESSFSWAIALKRHVLLNQRHLGEDYLSRNVTLDDDYSVLFGDKGASDQFALAMWP